MNSENLQKKIDALDYWDCEVVDFTINYFGDEAKMVLTCDTPSQSSDSKKAIYYIIKFLFCYQMEYKTDAKDAVWRKNIQVKDMNRNQLGHYMQEISIKKGEVNGFVEVNLNTSILFAKIVCRDIIIESVEYTDGDFFWSKNKK